MDGKEIVERVIPDWCKDGGLWLRILVTHIDAAIAQAVAREREGCAVEGDRFCVCGTGLDSFRVPKGMCCVCQYQKAIRARTP